jgi:hypothetical protein
VGRWHAEPGFGWSELVVVGSLVLLAGLAEVDILARLAARAPDTRELRSHLLLP